MIVCVCKIWDKTDKPLLNYSNLYWGAVFFPDTECICSCMHKTVQFRLCITAKIQSKYHSRPVLQICQLTSYHHNTQLIHMKSAKSSQAHQFLVNKVVSNISRSTQGSHCPGYQKFSDFPGPQKHFPPPCRKPAMFKYRNKQQLAY